LVKLAYTATCHAGTRRRARPRAPHAVRRRTHVEAGLGPSVRAQRPRVVLPSHVLLSPRRSVVRRFNCRAAQCLRAHRPRLTVVLAASMAWVDLATKKAPPSTPHLSYKRAPVIPRVRNSSCLPEPATAPPWPPTAKLPPPHLPAGG
jgi:hypothetical protein